MTLRLQKRIASSILKCGENRVRFDPSRLEDIEAAITRADVKQLIKDQAIVKMKEKGVSRGRTRKRSGRRGEGSRKGGKFAKISRKDRWIAKVRAQRKELRRLREKRLLDEKNYRKVYRLVKAGNFKSVSALRTHLRENNLLRRGLI